MLRLNTLMLRPTLQGRYTDHWLLGAGGLLLVFGLIMVASASVAVAERQTGEQLQRDQIETQTGHGYLQRGRAPMMDARPLVQMVQDLWPSASQVRRFFSVGSSVARTLKTSASPFSGFDLDSMMRTDCTA